MEVPNALYSSHLDAEYLHLKVKMRTRSPGSLAHCGRTNEVRTLYDLNLFKSKVKRPLSFRTRKKSLLPPVLDVLWAEDLLAPFYCMTRTSELDF